MIDGIKRSRLYGPWNYIPHLAPGEHEIAVSSNANTHAVLTVNGQPLAAKTVVVVE